VPTQYVTVSNLFNESVITSEYNPVGRKRISSDGTSSDVLPHPGEDSQEKKKPNQESPIKVPMSGKATSKSTPTHGGALTETTIADGIVKARIVHNVAFPDGNVTAGQPGGKLASGPSQGTYTGKDGKEYSYSTASHSHMEVRVSGVLVPPSTLAAPFCGTALVPVYAFSHPDLAR
jgi:hypothetical protein